MGVELMDRILVGIDVGGTFTDFVALVDGQLRVHKTSTTPADQSEAIRRGLADLGITRAEIVHGMTVATNALLERRGARTALLTTKGFADVLVIGRQNRPRLYALSQQRPPSLVGEQLRLEVNERLDHTGALIEPLDTSTLPALLTHLQAEGVESLAIVLLFSFRNPIHEQQLAAWIRQHLPDLPLSLSSEILPEYREYERTTTTVINAYVQPLVARYLQRLARALTGNSDERTSLRIMQSNGGVISLHQAADQPARLVLSGPAGGVVGGFAVARQALPADESVNLLTLDMGGTSTDVALCPGEVPTTAESLIDGLPLRLPVIDIHTVGAGGGSIAEVDAGGGLRVGPRSAGAQPGPVAYGRGGSEPTVTDANLVLGRLDASGFLGGSGDITLDLPGAQQALRNLAARLGLSPEAGALGVLRVVNATMERALRRVSVERGHDPRQFTLLPFGGAGPLHACDLADALGIRRILVPAIPGVLSAYGMLVADVANDASQSILQTVDALQADLSPLWQAYETLAARVLAVLQDENIGQPTLSAALDMRYRGQSYELTVPLTVPIDAPGFAQAVADFHQLHAQRYGYAMDAETVQVVTLRLRGHGAGANPVLPAEPTGPADASAARLADRSVWFTAEAPTATPCYDRTRLRAGHQFSGPALVIQFDATTLITPGWHARVDPYRNLWLTR